MSFTTAAELLKTEEQRAYTSLKQHIQQKLVKERTVLAKGWAIKVYVDDKQAAAVGKACTELGKAGYTANYESMGPIGSDPGAKWINIQINQQAVTKTPH